MKLHGVVLGMIAGRVAEEHGDDELYVGALLDEFAALYARLPQGEQEVLCHVFLAMAATLGESLSLPTLLSMREMERLDAMHHS